jgi:hypothetical protein
MRLPHPPTLQWIESPTSPRLEDPSTRRVEFSKFDDGPAEASPRSRRRSLAQKRSAAIDGRGRGVVHPGLCGIDIHRLQTSGASSRTLVSRLNHRVKNTPCSLWPSRRYTSPRGCRWSQCVRMRQAVLRPPTWTVRPSASKSARELSRYLRFRNREMRSAIEMCRPTTVLPAAVAFQRADFVHYLSK